MSGKGWESHILTVFDISKPTKFRDYTKEQKAI